MHDAGTIIGELLATRNTHTAEGGSSMFAYLLYLHIVTGYTTTEGNEIGVYIALSLLLYEERGEVAHLRVRIFEFIMLVLCAFSCKDFRYTIGASRDAVHSMVAHEELRFAVFTYHDKVVRRSHQGHVGAHNVDDLDREIERRIIGHVDEESVLGEHTRKGCYAIVEAVGLLA